MTTERQDHAVESGSRVRGALAGLLDPATMARIADPVLADYQKEASAPDTAGRPLRLALLRMRWAVALVLALLLDFALGTVGASEREFRRRLCRSSAIGCSVVVSLVLAAAWSTVVEYSQRTHQPLLVPQALVYLLPSALAVGIPCGLLLGSLLPRREARASARPLFVVAVGAACVVVCLLGFVVPTTNQMYRLSVWHAFVETPSMMPPAKGLREMSFAELGARARDNQTRSMPAHVSIYAVERQRRLALAVACLVLTWLGAAFADSGASRSFVRRFAFAAVVVVVYYGLFEWGTYLATRLTVESTLSVWLANGCFGVVAGVTQIIRRQLAFRPPQPT